MPIRFGNRTASLALELTLTLPVILMVMLIAGFVLEAMVFRHELAFSVRNAAAQAAAEGPCLSQIPDRSGTVRTTQVQCHTIDDERGLHSERPFFSAMSQSADRHWSGFLRDIDPRAPVPAHIAEGQGTFQIQNVAFLAGQFGQTSSQYTQRRPDAALWTHFRSPWQAAYDPVVWQRLSQRGTSKLFPNVFPAR